MQSDKESTTSLKLTALKRWRKEAEERETGERGRRAEREVGPGRFFRRVALLFDIEARSLVPGSQRLAQPPLA